METVADLMRAWRRAAGLTTAAGERLGLSARTIEDIEQGRTSKKNNASAKPVVIVLLTCCR